MNDNTMSNTIPRDKDFFPISELLETLERFGVIDVYLWGVDMDYVEILYE